jgi:hypothetical protein
MAIGVTMITGVAIGDGMTTAATTVAADILEIF